MEIYENSRTSENMRALMCEIALSCAEYEIFSNIARAEGYDDAAQFFDKIAKNELALLETHLKDTNGLGSTPENLLTTTDLLERRIRHDMNKVARDAELDGFDELAQRILLEKDLHIRQLVRAEELYDAFFDAEYADEAMKYYGCRNCGHCARDAVMPSKCPLCGYPRHFFYRCRG